MAVKRAFKRFEINSLEPRLSINNAAQKSGDEKKQWHSEQVGP